MYSAYIQTLCCLPFIAGVVWWFPVTQMSLSFLQSCYYTVVQINCKARFILGKFWVPWNKTACMLLYNSVDLLSKEAGTLIFLSTVVKKSCSVDKFSMCLVQYFSVCLDPPPSPICHLLTLRKGNSILSKQSASEKWGRLFKSSFWMRPFTKNQNKYNHSSL